ncbi:hypothetical protein V1264_017545 [Littorina saxatilis]|uniref:Uncharacterized protein n=1 Tax=Littorina saxatilis TaxID=31220 RepID=A0AAN9GFI6_9CAEN
MGFFGRIFDNLCLSLIFFCGTNLAKTDFETICRSDPVAEGETAMMNISLRPQIDLNKQVFIYLKKDGDSADTLRCDRQEPELQLKCTTINGSRFHTGGLVDHDLRVIVPNVTVDLEGVYVLRVYVDHAPDPTTKCVLSVLAATGEEQWYLLYAS